jgi:hypothetical protein
MINFKNNIMKHISFVLAPKAVLILIVTLLFNTLEVNAQENLFAVSAPRLSKEAPKAAEATFKMRLTHLAKDSLLFRLLIENPTGEKLMLYIKDTNSNILLRETLPTSTKYEARYNLQSLEDGSYTFEIRNGKTKVAEKAIDIKTETQVNRSVSLD